MKLCSNTHGFTLIEAMVAIFILTIGILGFYQITVSSLLTNSRANNMTLASAQVAGAIEVIRQQPYSTLVSSTAATQITDPETGYVTTWTVVDNAPIAGAKFVQVQIIIPNGGSTVTYDYVRHDDGT